MINKLTHHLKRRPRLVAVGLLIMLYGLCGFFVAPALLESSLVSRVQQDYDAALRVERIAINPFTLSLEIDGLELDNPDGDASARIGEIFVNLQLSSIFRGALTLKEVRLVSPHLFVARDAAGNFDFEYLLPAGDSTDTTVESSAETAPFPILVFDFSLQDATIDWHDRSTPEPVKTRLGPIAIGIDELNTLPDRAGRQSVTITTEHGARLSWQGDLQLHPLKSSGRAVIEGAFFPLVSAYLRHRSGIDFVNGLTHVEFNYDLADIDGAFRAHVEQIDIRITEFATRSFADGTGFDFAGPDAPILSIEELRIEGGDLRWPEKTLALQSIRMLRPAIDLSRSNDGVFNLQPASAGAATDDPPAGTGTETTGEADWQVSLGEFAIDDLTLDFTDRVFDPEITHRVEGFDLKVTGIDNQPGQRFPASLSLRVASGGELTLEGEVGVLPDLELDLAVALDGLRLAVSEPYLQQQVNLNFNSGMMHLDGRIRTTSSEPLAFSGELEVSDLELAESIDDARVAAWQTFAASRIDLSLGERRIDIGGLRFDGLYGDILIDRERRLNVNRVTRAEAVAEGSAIPAESAQETGPPDPAFAVQIGSIELADASLDFRDLSLPLPFEARIEALNGGVSTVSNTSDTPAEVSLEGTVNEFGRVRIDGTLTPLDPPRNTDLQVDFSNIDLPPMTPYSIQFAGRKISSGQLDLGLGYQVKDSELVGANRIVLRNLELGEPVPSDDALDLPFDLAIALLTDVEGKIGIDLPISGNLDKPDFQYGQVVLSAFTDLLTKIVLSPFSALGNILGADAGEMAYIEFDPGRADLAPPQREKALRLAEALAQRPQLRLVARGIADPSADGRALRAAKLDALLDTRIEQLAATADPETTLMQRRQATLEQLLREQSDGDVSERLDTLRQRFTKPTVIEGQPDPVPTLDSLAYTAELRRQLIELQPLDDSELLALADARADALIAGLLAPDATLAKRVSRIESELAAQDPPQNPRTEIELQSID